MPAIAFGLNAYDHEDFGLPSVRLENWYAEPAPDRPEKGVRLIPIPGAVQFAALGVLQGRGAFQSDGVLGGDIVAVGGGAVSRITSAGVVTSLTGIVANDSLPVLMAASQTPQLIMASGGTVYEVTATAVTSFTWTGPTGPIIAVDEINQRHLYLEGGSGRLWFSAVANAKTIGAIAFVTAESEPDQALALAVFAGTIIVAGTVSTELFRPTGDSNIPIVGRPGGVIEKGVISKYGLLSTSFGLFMVGVGKRDGPAVYDISGFRAGAPISTRPIERALSGLSTADRAKVRLSNYSDGSHAFLHLFIPGKGDYFYDASTGLWHRRLELDKVHYRYSHYVQAFGKLLAQDTTSGRIVELSESIFDDVGSPIKRLTTALISIDENATPVRNIVIDAQTGVGLAGSVLGSDPTGMLRVAFDGLSYGDVRYAPLGKLGEHRHRTIFSNIGLAEPPVIGIEFSVSDPVGYSPYQFQFNLGRL